MIGYILMEDLLKEAIEEIVSDTIPYLENLLEEDKLDIKRIVFYWEDDSEIKDSGKINEILSRTTNLFLTTQFKIDRTDIKVESMRYYRKYRREHLKGDYVINVGKWLSSIYSRKFNHSEAS